jgi:DNA-binding SARP family transcriptional activator
MSPWLLKTVAALGLGGRGVAALKVLAVLWPDADGDQGMQVFEVTLSRLRKMLGSEGRRALRLERGRIFLDRSLCWTDLEALEALMADVTRLSSSAGAEKADSQSNWRARLERVLALYVGPFVGSEEAPAQLVAFERRLRSRVAATVLAIGEEIRRSGGDPAAVESASLRALEADPGLDQLLAPAVRALIRKGHRKHARALVDLCRQAGGDSDEAARLL